MTSELESSSKKVFESSLKINANEELQRSMNDLAEALQKSESEIKAKNQELEEIKEEKSKIENLCAEQSVKVEDIRSRLSQEAKRSKDLEDILRAKESSYQGEVESITKQLNYAVSKLQQVKTELEEKNLLKEEVQARVQETNSLQTMIRTLENNLRDKERMANLAQSQENVLKDRIKELEGTISQLKSQKIAAEKSFSDKIKALEAEIERLTEKIKNLLETLKEKEYDVETYQSQISIFLSKNNDLSQKLEQSASKYSSLESLYKDAKLKYGFLEKEKQEIEKTLFVRENQIKEALGKIKIVENEIFAKDSAIINKEGIILKLTKDLEENKRALQQAHGRFRANLAEELKNFEIQLEQKEQEIKILKDMIRSGQTQLKQKEGEVARYKHLIQPQTSARVLPESKKNGKNKLIEKSTNSVVLDKITCFFNDLESLRSFKEAKLKEIQSSSQISDSLIDASDPEGSLNDLISSRFLALLGNLQNSLKKLGTKSIPSKFLPDKIQLDKDEIDPKELLEIINTMTP